MAFGVDSASTSNTVNSQLPDIALIVFHPGLDGLNIVELLDLLLRMRSKGPRRCMFTPPNVRAERYGIALHRTNASRSVGPASV
jgi:hypothetical protein